MAIARRFVLTDACSLKAYKMMILLKELNAYANALCTSCQHRQLADLHSHLVIKLHIYHLHTPRTMSNAHQHRWKSITDCRPAPVNRKTILILTPLFCMRVPSDLPSAWSVTVRRGASAMDVGTSMHRPIKIPYQSMWAERERKNFRSPLKPVFVTSDPRSATSRSRSSQ